MECFVSFRGGGGSLLVAFFLVLISVDSFVLFCFHVGLAFFFGFNFAPKTFFAVTLVAPPFIFSLGWFSTKYTHIFIVRHDDNFETLPPSHHGPFLLPPKYWKIMKRWNFVMLKLYYNFSLVSKSNKQTNTHTQTTHNEHTQRTHNEHQVKEGDIVTMCSATFGDQMWSTRGVGLTRVLAAIRVRAGPTVKLVFESPQSYKKKAVQTTKQLESQEQARKAAQQKKDALLAELEEDEQKLKKGKFLGLF
jgi:hypothetical protein